MKALVTGGAGFIGHHLVQGLSRQGHEVVILDDLSTGRLDRPWHGRPPRIVLGDIRDGARVREAMVGCDVVFHEAALVSVAKSMVDPVSTNSINVEGTIEVMLAAAAMGVRRVVVASSSAVYGADGVWPSRESHLPDPQSPYATSKLAVEHYVRNLGSANGIETVALRYFNVYGPGQDPDAEYAAVVPRFILAGLSSSPATVYGDGLQSRDFIYVGDVVAANLLAATAPDVDGLVVNVGTGDRRTLMDLLEAVADATDHREAPNLQETRAGDVRDSQADVTLAATRLGFRARTDLVEGIRSTVSWYSEQLAPARS